jgi:hypothetical protein
MIAIADPPLKLILMENRDQGGSLNHLGVEVREGAGQEPRTVRLKKLRPEPGRRPAARAGRGSHYRTRSLLSERSYPIAIK